MGSARYREGRFGFFRDASPPMGLSVRRLSSWGRVSARAFGLLVVFMVMLCTACENTIPSEEDRIVVEEAVTVYLHALADAYSSLSVEPLDDVATGNEIEEVRRTLRGLTGTGDRVEARLLSVEFASVTVFREVNATVTTTEVWEVTRFEAFTGRQRGHNPTSIQDSIIQLRLIDGYWRVSARRVVGQEAGPRWTIETPVPAGKNQ